MKTCEWCGAELTRGQKQFCTTRCRGDASRGHPRQDMSPEAWARVHEACREARTGKVGAESHAWEGDAAGYFGIHQWINKHWSKTGRCDQCGRQGDKTHWANIDGKYDRNDRVSWSELCPSCHKLSHTRTEPDTDETQRRCPRCKEIKPARLFVRSKNKPGGRGNYCLSCSRERARERKARLAS